MTTTIPTFQKFSEAEQAASGFFKKNFDHSGRVGVEVNVKEGTWSFYSKDDPAMDDTFECIIIKENA